MDFLNEIDRILPDYLSKSDKSRLKDGLIQFYHSKNYTEFYSSKEFNYLLQGDLIKEIKFTLLNSQTREYEKVYHDVMLLSNTCDIDCNNERKIEKKVIIGKVVELELFENTLIEMKVKNIQDILNKVRKQEYSNIFYTPEWLDKKERLIYLDELSDISVGELSNLLPNIKNERLFSLDYFGHYLLLFKLSYHFCRTPEDNQR